MSILENIHGHRELAALSAEARMQLCNELRQFLITKVSQTGGHVSSNLGVVELTVAIETVFDTSKDRLVFDVGHQSYIHKMLTGRQDQFDQLRQFGGIAGFPKPSESECDAFVAGHASSSVSVALGMARARTLQNQDYSIVALIGDGAATGGMAYEGLNDAAVSNEPLVIVLNDNALSIDRNVGGMASHLRQLRIKQRYLGMKQFSKTLLFRIPGGRPIYRLLSGLKSNLRRILIPTTIFESMGFTYLGPVDGHDTENLIMLLKAAKEMNRPVVVHTITEKGRGYAPAQEHPKLFHGIGIFEPESGVPLKKREPTYSDAFGRTMVELAENNKKLCAITAAMPGGTGLLEFKNRYADRLFDVGIAEEHAVSMAGGLAKQGMIPVVAIYSTFLQRAYDMILQDICMLHLHVVFAVDRAGLVGEDGETHHGIYDVGFLRHAPGLTVLSPSSREELQQMLRWAVEEQDGPVAIRYPRGSDRGDIESAWDAATDGVIFDSVNASVQLLTYGSLVQNAKDAAKILKIKGVDVGVTRLLKLAPLPIETVARSLPPNVTVIVLEETSANCGICQELSHGLRNLRSDCKVYGVDLGNKYVTHGTMADLYDQYGLSAEKVADFAMEVHHSEK